MCARPSMLWVKERKVIKDLRAGCFSWKLRTCFCCCAAIGQGAGQGLSSDVQAMQSPLWPTPEAFELFTPPSCFCYTLGRGELVLRSTFGSPLFGVASVPWFETQMCWHHRAARAVAQGPLWWHCPLLLSMHRDLASGYLVVGSW